ncbi:PucR family transcriptional regulator [Brevibacillus sp. TJ4]|uniref:PucR family transcriptional regulator n=1 Tax=Brevibacillus sp. TJ4 TaxID=3234853 RepID=UPI003BA1D75D
MNWPEETDKIAQATGLPIICLQGLAHEIAQWEKERNEQGWETVFRLSQGECHILIMIASASWPAAARAMLQLYLPQKQAAPDDVLASWLGDLYEHGRLAPPPPLLEQFLPWREERVCFLLERHRADGTFSWTEIHPLLDTFFASAEPARLSVRVRADAMLLLVPLSQLGSEHAPEHMLEWASGLHELLAVELMEPIRLLVSPPIAAPGQIGHALVKLRQLSIAIRRYRQSVWVAGTWQHALEQWAASLDDDTASKLTAGLSHALSAVTLSKEQVETLEALFARQLNVSETARHLFLHRNSLQYRLDKLTEQTGLDPRLFPDAVLLQLYLFFRKN